MLGAGVGSDASVASTAEHCRWNDPHGSNRELLGHRFHDQGGKASHEVLAANSGQ